MHDTTRSKRTRRAIHLAVVCLQSVALLAVLSSAAIAADLPRVYVEPAQTLDASNQGNKAQHIDFGSAISAALIKKKVPVAVVTDSTKAQWTIKTASSQREDGQIAKAARVVVLGVFAGNGTKFEGTIQVIDNETSAVLFALNVKKGSFKKAAETFASNFKGRYLKNYLKNR